MLLGRLPILNSLFTQTFKTSPKPNINVNIAEPPYEISGKGTPTTGSIPITIEIFTKTYKKNVTIIPMANNFPN